MINAAPSSRQADDPELNAESFERIARIAKQNWGLHLMEAKRPMIKSRLRKRIQVLGLPSFEDYCCLIEDPDQFETEFLITAITTNVTHFYREVHHFEHLERDILPDLLDRARSGDRIRIWSAGCSSGQEPYSLAGAFLAADAQSSRYNLKILATDVDNKIIQAAMAGSYRKSDISFPEKKYKNRIFETTDSEGDFATVRHELSSLIQFKILNLMDPWPFVGRFDVIMCRNVAIYFDKPTQQKLWSRFAQCLTPNGNLYIGHSERIYDPEKIGLRITGTTAYNKSQ